MMRAVKEDGNQILDPERGGSNNDSVMRIALIGFTSEYFLPFARALEESGIQVFWVHSLKSFTRYLFANSIPASRILDLSDVLDWQVFRDSDMTELSELESAELPRINNIILMDRLLRRKSYSFAVSYLAHCARKMACFFRQESIGYVASGRDTALQLLSMLVSRKHNLVWACTTYMRLPTERFMFTRTHETDQIFPLGEVSQSLREEARSFLVAFRGGVTRPHVRPSSLTWGRVIRRFPSHLREGWRLLLNARFDRRNDFARYTLPSLILIWLRKKLNLLQCQLFVRMEKTGGSRPYLLFGLHRQPESSIDVIGAYFSDQRMLVQTVARSMPIGFELLVKLHVSDADGWPARYLNELASIPGVRLISPLVNSHELLRHAALVVTNSGTMAYEAALFGKPAITFSKVHFNALPGVTHCSSPSALPQILDTCLKQKKYDETKVIEVLASFLAHSFSGLPNRSVFHSGLNDHDLVSLVQAYHALRLYTEGSREGT
jgi:hypothetical protein